MGRLTGCERSNCDDGEENAKTSWPQSRLAAHSANRRFDSHDIYLRPAQAAGIFVFQTLAIAGLLPIGALIISGNPIAFGLLSIAFIQFCRLFLTTVLSVALQPASVGRCMVDHRGYARNCGRASSVRVRPHHLTT